MKRRSLILRLWAFAAAVSLAFTQVALAAFACPLGEPQMHQEMASEDCHDADPGTRHLCVKTCQDEPQKYEVVALAALPPSTDGGLRIQGADLQAEPQGVRRDTLLVRATSPPATVLYSRFLK